jgi:hypothetical protein
VIPTIPAAGLSTEQLRQADEATRHWYLRVLMLVNDTGCALDLAIVAIQAVDEATEANSILKQRVAGSV